MVTIKKKKTASHDREENQFLRSHSLSISLSASIDSIQQNK